jgi:hypothetical protein
VEECCDWKRAAGPRGIGAWLSWCKGTQKTNYLRRDSASETSLQWDFVGAMAEWHYSPSVDDSDGGAGGRCPERRLEPTSGWPINRERIHLGEL